MKIKYLFLLLSLTLCGCKNKDNEKPIVKMNNYGAFLGRSDNNVKNFGNYDYLSIELNEFTDTNIKRFINKGISIFAYLNIGSLENYRDYYEDFEDITFKDYEEWPDERWIDVSDTSWQDYVINTLAADFKDRKATGVYLDNLDVYSVAKEEKLNYISYANGIKNIIKGINNLGLKVMINGGSEFIDDMNDQNDSIFDSIWGYHQEEVFSSITNYENNTFGTQDKEDTEYYQEISSLMKEKGKEVFYLEYTNDNNLIDKIADYCTNKGYHYYIANNINLD